MPWQTHQQVAQSLLKSSFVGGYGALDGMREEPWNPAWFSRCVCVFMCACMYSYIHGYVYMHLSYVHAHDVVDTAGATGQLSRRARHSSHMCIYACKSSSLLSPCLGIIPSFYACVCMHTIIWARILVHASMNLYLRVYAWSLCICMESSYGWPRSSYGWSYGAVDGLQAEPMHPWWFQGSRVCFFVYIYMV